MRIIVNHLTRMSPGYICVAGVEPHSGKHIRPTGYGRLTRDLLYILGGPFDMAALVDIGNAIPDGITPEVEDHHCEPARARYLSTVTASDFWTLLETLACPALGTIFGPELQRTGSTCAVPRGKGLASLGCLKPASRPRLEINTFGTLRMRVSDGITEASVPVTDLRLFKDDHKTIRSDVVADLNRRLERGVRVILSVGLSRPYAKPGDDEERHWLQVNGIHLEDNPVWLVQPAATTPLDDLDLPF